MNNASVSPAEVNRPMLVTVLCKRLCWLWLGCLLLGSSVQAGDAVPGSSCELPRMTNQRLDELINRIGADIESSPGYWKFTVADAVVTVITDAKADRMRILLPIAEREGLSEAQLQRILQANFDSALDARYALAKNILWSTFIHPLAALQEAQFLSGVGQVINLAESFGSSYSSGALIFRGGDSEGLRRKERIDKIINRGLAI